MEALKQRGNALYAQKKYDDAIQVYDEALTSLPLAAREAGSDDDKEVQEETKEISKLRGTILANRAACHLQSKRWEACVQDASEALQSDRQHVKALYRRAQAYEAMGSLEKAFQDLRLAVHLEPTSQELVRAAHRLREATQKQEAGRQTFPVAQLLARLQNGDDEGASSSCSRADAWKGLIGLASEDGAAALDLLQQQGGGVGFLETCIHNRDRANERVLALRLLAACCQHGAFVKQAFISSSDTTTVGSSFLQDLVKLLGEEREETTEKEEEKEEVARVLVMIFLRAVKEDEGHVQILTPALQCWAAAMSQCQGTIQTLGLEALLWWSGDYMGTKNSGLTTLLVKPCLTPLVRLIEDAQGASTLAMRLSATQLLGRIIFGLLAQEKGEERVKTLATELLTTRTTPTIPAARKLELRLLVALALFNADASLGCWFLEEEETDAAVRTLLASGAPESRVVVAEVINRASTTEAGRVSLRPYVLDHTLVRLMKASGAPFEARMAAAAAFTKLGLAAKALPSTSTELTDLLNIAGEGLEQATATVISTSPAPFDGTSMRASAVVESAVEILSCLATRTALKRELTFGSGRCKACVPLLLALLQQRISEGASSGKTATSSNSNSTSSTSSSVYDRVWYGAAFVLASLTLSNDELRKEALREKDIEPEEFEQLRKIQEMQQQQQQQQQQQGAGGGDAIEAADPPEDVEKRVKELVRLNGIRALCHLLSLKGLSPLAQEQVATALVQIATVTEVRGRLIQEGGYNACLSMAKEGASSMEATRIKALHALAKCLVTTDPKMLSDRQRLAPITGLLWLCRHPKATNLQQFESLLALTNLASYEQDCVEAIIGNQGLKCLLSLQFSEHVLVRRAATEAMCNMVYHPRVLASLRNPDTLKLWLALADDYEGDLPTARAAAGGLAMASKDEELAKAIMEVPTTGLSVWRTLLSSGDRDLVHRATVALRNLVHFEGPRQTLLEEGGLLSALKLTAAGGGLPDDLHKLMQAVIAEIDPPTK